jgi:DNA modification methylase
MTITLLHGDCMELLRGVEKFDAVVTDPPYKMEIHGRGFAAKRSYYSRLDYGTTTEFQLSQEFYDLLLARLTEKNMVFFCNKLMKLDIENWAVDSGFTFDELVLLKSSPSPLTNNQWLPDKEFAVHVFRDCAVKGDYSTKKTYFEAPNFQQRDIDHPSVKPLHIVKHIIANITNEGDTVIDPFMGSGTTGVACVELNRHFIGIERDEKHFALAKRRIEFAASQPDFFRPITQPDAKGTSGGVLFSPKPKESSNGKHKRKADTSAAS